MILVTGGTGLVGAHLLLHLTESEDKVRAIYRSGKSINKTKTLFDLQEKQSLFSKIEWIEADILDIPSLENAFENISVVYHCAALISFDPKDEEKLRKINIEGTANIVNFCIDYGIQKLCYMSSIAALGDVASNETWITEDTEWNPEKPHSDYAISKYGAEMEVWRAFQEGVPVIILNPGVIIGTVATAAIFTGGSAELYHKTTKGLSFYTLGSTGVVTVTDVCRIAIQLINSTIINERYTLVAENISIKSLIEAIANRLQKRPPHRHATPIMMNIIWILDWFYSTLFFQKRTFSRATAKATYSMTLYDNSKIKAALGGATFTSIVDYIKNN